uniref:UTP--glucose-1-phosphate uridylyltransferase n=1 Tax=Heterorhabditis bacteriophora TaxID=37862 RepID=A0A1I7XCT8_HETBA
MADGQCFVRDVLDRLVVVKLNGGLGTTMGCEGPKSFIKVKNNLSFLDIALQQHKVTNIKFICKPINNVFLLLISYDINLVNKWFQLFNEINGCNVPLYLMNSFYTDEATLKVLNQQKNVWYPPGHGNIFQSLYYSGTLDQLLNDGRDIMFISNIDNTGATLNLSIAQFMCDNKTDYIMECTEKTQSDIKGGTLIDIDGQLMHLEIPQVPPEHIDEFCSIRTFKIFNTNNIWVNLNAVKQRLSSIRSEIIVNRKTLSSGRDVIQLETSVGGAICNFPNAFCIHVNRDRFLPVKRTEDLLALSSLFYSVDPSRSLCFPNCRPTPIIKLGKFFEKVADFHARFPYYPNMSCLKSLCIVGDILFEKNITLKGNVSIINKTGKQCIISSGSILEDEEKIFE